MVYLFRNSLNWKLKTHAMSHIVTRHVYIYIRSPNKWRSSFSVMKRRLLVKYYTGEVICHLKSAESFALNWRLKSKWFDWSKLQTRAMYCITMKIPRYNCLDRADQCHTAQCLLFLVNVSIRQCRHNTLTWRKYSRPAGHCPVQCSLPVLCAAQNLYKAAGVSQVGLQLHTYYRLICDV